MLQSALKKTLGDKVSQKGSLVAFDRLRFDFDLPRAMTEDELVIVENLINAWIGEAVDLDTKVMALADAKQSGAIAMFGEKYDEQVGSHMFPYLTFAKSCPRFISFLK